MKRGDRTVLSITVVLAVAAVAAVAFSMLVLDRRPRPSASGADSTSSLLVLTWGPSLCAVESANSGCKSGHVAGLGRTFVLHGLWPQPSTEQYCAVPRDVPDRKRSPVDLPDDLKARLQTRMSDQSFMTTHEWYAHGTCSGVTPPEYFSIATDLADEGMRVLNTVFGTASGGELAARSVRQSFDGQFGTGAGKRVALSCKKTKGNDVVYEVKLSLPPVTALREGGRALPLREALQRGPTIGAGCAQARVP